MLARIDEAEKYVYMENFSIHDPDVITHLATRIRKKREAGQPFQVILVIGHDPPPPGYQAVTPYQKSQYIYSWLHYVTYVALSIESSSECTFNTLPGGGGPQKTVTRATDGKTTWDFDPAWKGDWYENSQFKWDTGSVSIKDIVGFTNDTSLYKLVSTPSRFTGQFGFIEVHAKVAIIDDKFAAIGSANFNPRSMKKDDELDAFITADSTTPVIDFRQALWGEHFPSSKGPGSFAPSEWSTLASDNLMAMMLGRITAGREYIFPIKIDDYERTEPALGILGLLGSLFDKAEER